MAERRQRQSWRDLHGAAAGGCHPIFVNGCLAILRPKGDRGEMTLNVETDALQSETVFIR